MPGSNDAKRHPVTLAADIVQAYVKNNSIPYSALPGLVAAVGEIFATLSKLEAPANGLSLPVIARTIGYDHLISLEDGKPYRSLKQHLTARGLTPDQYRAKWNLPPDYPMLAPGFSETRAKQIYDRTAKRRAKAAKEAKVKTGAAQTTASSASAPTQPAFL